MVFCAKKNTINNRKTEEKGAELGFYYVVWHGAPLVRQQAQELRTLRHHELVTYTSMNNVSNVAFTYTHVVDTPMNDGANFSFNDINKHSPEEEWGDMIGEGNTDDVEGSIYDE